MQPGMSPHLLFICGINIEVGIVATQAGLSTKQKYCIQNIQNIKYIPKYYDIFETI